MKDAMFDKSLFIQPASGFVPFAGAADVQSHDRSSAPLNSTADWAAHVQARTGWEAPAGVGVRRVEMLILASVCGYFTFGLGGLLGLY